MIVDVPLRAQADAVVQTGHELVDEVVTVPFRQADDGVALFAVLLLRGTETHGVDGVVRGGAVAEECHGGPDDGGCGCWGFGRRADARSEAGGRNCLSIW